MRFFTVFNLALLMLLAAAVTLISPGHLLALINIPGLLVVFAGTPFALISSKPQHKVLQLLRELPDIAHGPQASAVHVRA